MKYIKMLGLAAVAAAALMAFVGASSASATVLCKTSVVGTGGICPTGWGYSGEIHGVAEVPPVLTGTINIECEESTVQGNATEGTGSPTETPNGAITTLTFTGNCNCEVVVVKNGTLEIHADG